jgi:hypothetical protein
LGITSSRWETLPIAQLTTAIAAVEAGKFDPDILTDVIERTDDLGRLARALESMARIVSARDRRLKLLHTVIPVGVSLSAERDFDRLLETIVREAQAVCNADAGTLYLRTDDDRLKFVIVSNNSLDIAAGGTTGRAITFPPLRLYDEETGAPNHHNVATHAALSHRWINIPDAYQCSRPRNWRRDPFRVRRGDRIAGLVGLIRARSLHSRRKPETKDPGITHQSGHGPKDPPGRRDHRDRVFPTVAEKGPSSPQ